MDHAISSLKEHLEAERDWVIDQWRTGDYKKITDCPSYQDVKTIIAAIHILEKHYYGEKKTLSARELFD